MSKVVLLNNVDHKDLRIITRRASELGDGVNGSLVFPAEFLEVHKEYPIYFQKSADTGEFQAIALFGFAAQENLFLTEGRWGARYIPALMRREPFSIGMQKAPVGQGEQTPVLMVDMESPRVSSTSEGALVFKENGGSTSFLDEVNKALSLVHEGFPAAKSMFNTFLSLDLIEPFVLDIQFDDRSHFKTNIFYTINQENLSALRAETLEKLHVSGLLQLAYMVLESLSNVRALIEKRNAMAR